MTSFLITHNAFPNGLGATFMPHTEVLEPGAFLARFMQDANARTQSALFEMLDFADEMGISLSLVIETVFTPTICLERFLLQVPDENEAFHVRMKGNFSIAGDPSDLAYACEQRLSARRTI
jgi:hypothetical protein